MSIALSTQVTITTARIEAITIQLYRDHAEAAATVAILDAGGNVVRRETAQHPNADAFVKSLIAIPKQAFDDMDALLVSKYPGTVGSNEDVDW